MNNGKVLTQTLLEQELEQRIADYKRRIKILEKCLEEIRETPKNFSPKIFPEKWT